ncbi:GNAT family N-acetyltransferase [Pseudoalteromonas piscicida]|uniref:GNAT family N-acetyltransferase n=1 Tax=Pseudoalteromonas piscicida TaxID=43662 RepID=UPI0027384A3D|nr:GNAT family N-acetyltransferase [Pseudoalteromonas piscicida]MDP4489410.1 GNAT family N-acetyltransferase [Pseudoalteromonas piscicida]
MKIRAATINDLTTLLDLEQQVIEAERPYNPTIKSQDAKYYGFEKLLNCSNTLVIVGEVSEQIVATGYVQIRASKQQLQHTQHGYLGFMYVAPEHRGKGLNQEIMEHLIAWCKTQNVNDFYLDVYSSNAAAIRAYEKAGFTPCLLEMKLHL